jgi:hypothetical protein
MYSGAVLKGCWITSEDIYQRVAARARPGHLSEIPLKNFNLNWSFHEFTKMLISIKVINLRTTSGSSL